MEKDIMNKIKSELTNCNMMYTYKKDKNKKESFNRFLYDSKKDNCKEYNSGELLVDSTGYVPLRDLILKCGLNLPAANWSTFDFGIDKFNDNFEVQNAINSVINNSVQKTKENNADTPSIAENTTAVTSESEKKE